MPTLTSMGYKKPSTGERDYFPTLEFNIDHGNSHSHNGVNGERISTKDLSKQTGSISSGSWSAVSGQTGTYRQLITVPTGYAVSTSEMKFYVDGGDEDGDQIFPTVEKVSSTTYYVYINDNSVALKVVYG